MVFQIGHHTNHLGDAVVMPGVLEVYEVFDEWGMEVLEPVGEVGIGDHSHVVSLDSPNLEVKKLVLQGQTIGESNQKLIVTDNTDSRHAVCRFQSELTRSTFLKLEIQIEKPFQGNR